MQFETRIGAVDTGAGCGAAPCCFGSSVRASVIDHDHMILKALALERSAYVIKKQRQGFGFVIGRKK